MRSIENMGINITYNDSAMSSADLKHKTIK